MTLARTRLTCDGKVRVKVSGQRRKVFEVPFLDKYRRKAFRNLRLILERLNINVIEEKLVTRVVNVDYEDGRTTYTHNVEVEDTVLRASFNPGPEILELCPSLKREYPILFKYDGKGVFNVSTIGKLSEEEEADIEKFVTYCVKPQYQMAFLKDSALQSKQTEEGTESREKPVVALKKNDIKTNKPDEIITVETEKTNERKNLNEDIRNKIDDQAEEMLAIEEIKDRIKHFQPEGFRESVAYERYLQALSSNPGKEEEIHRVFYTLVIGKKNFKDFYRKLYAYIPELLKKHLQ